MAGTSSKIKLVNWKTIGAAILAATMAIVGVAPTDKAEAYIAPINFEDHESGTQGEATLRGVVFELIDGVRIPISGLTVRARFENENDPNIVTVLTTSTDENGFYSLQGFGPGFAAVYVSDFRDPSVFADTIAETRIRTDQPVRQRDIRVYPAGVGTFAGTIVQPPGYEGSMETQIWLFDTNKKKTTFIESPDYVAETDAEGRFEFSRLPFSDYELKIKLGYNYDHLELKNNFDQPLITNRQFTLSAESPDIVRNLQLVPAPGNSLVRGEILNQDSLSPYFNVTVELRSVDQNDGPSYRTTTDAEGQWSFAYVRSGKYSLYYYFPAEMSLHYIREESPSILVPENDSVVAPRLLIREVFPGDGTLLVSVRSDVNGRPVPNAEVQITLNGSSEYQSYTVFTNPGGQARFTELPEGEYSVTAFDRDSLISYVQGPKVSIRDGSNKTLRLDMPNTQVERAVTVIGRVKKDSLFLESAQVYLNWSASYSGDCAGDGFGLNDFTDESGTFIIEGVPVGLPLSFIVASTDFGSEFGEFQSSFTVPDSAQSVFNIGEISVSEGFSISGKLEMRDEADSIPSWLQLEVLDNSSGEIVKSFYADSSGRFRLENLAQGSYKLFVREIVCGDRPNPRILGGYVKSDGTISGDFSLASSFSTDIDLGSVILDQGASITGQVGLGSRGDFTFDHNKDFYMLIYQKNGTGWKDVTKFYTTQVNGARNGVFKIEGLPEGQYKIGASSYREAANFDPIFFGNNGQVSNLSNAKVFALTGTNTINAGSLIMEASEPNSSATRFSIDELTASENQVFRDQYSVNRVVAGSELLVGDQYAGDWLFVELLDRGASNFSEASLSLQSTNNYFFGSASNGRVSGWHQVSVDGRIFVPHSDVFRGEVFSVVQDTRSRLVGWTASKESTRDGQVESSPLLTAPKVIVLPKVTGKRVVGDRLRLDSGAWSGNPRPKLSIQWLRCASPVNIVSKTRPSSCKNIRGAIRKGYLLRDQDKGKYVSVRIIATNGSGSEKIFLTAKRKIR